jgi:hypothetical protein
VATKIGTGLESAVSLSPAKARKLIREGAAKAVRNVRKGKVQTVTIDPPYEWEVRVKEGKEDSLGGYLKREGASQLDSRSAVIRTSDPRAVLR